MPLSAYIVLAGLTIICAFAAQRLAMSKERKPLPWMIAALWLGPFALIPLAFMSKHSHA
jgi:hypothetical protein